MNTGMMVPFVKWAGGKRQMLEQLTLRMPDEYGIYYEDGVHYQTIETNEDGIAYLEEIHLGKYYLQEIDYN